MESEKVPESHAMLVSCFMEGYMAHEDFKLKQAQEINLTAAIEALSDQSVFDCTAAS